MEQAVDVARNGSRERSTGFSLTVNPARCRVTCPRRSASRAYQAVLASRHSSRTRLRSVARVLQPLVLVTSRLGAVSRQCGVSEAHALLRSLAVQSRNGRALQRASAISASYSPVSSSTRAVAAFALTESMPAFDLYVADVAMSSSLAAFKTNTY